MKLHQPIDPIHQWESEGESPIERKPPDPIQRGPYDHIKCPICGWAWESHDDKCRGNLINPLKPIPRRGQ